MATNQPATWRNLPTWKNLPADRHEIYVGPSMMKLKDALFMRIPKPQEISFTITSKNGPSVICTINGLRVEDGSGESWLFEGYSSTNRLRPTQVRGCFNVRTGRGWIEYIAE